MKLTLERAIVYRARLKISFVKDETLHYFYYNDEITHIYV